MANIYKDFTNSKFEIHPQYKNRVYEVIPVEPDDVMNSDDEILGTVARFKEQSDWFIFIYNLTSGGADILRLGEGDTKYKRVSESIITPEMFFFKLLNKQYNEKI